MVRGALLSLLATGILALAQQTQVPAVWAMDNAGYRIDVVREGGVPCAVIVPPAQPGGPGFGSMEKRLDAAPFRGKTVRFSAWIRVQSAGLKDSAQLWMRVNRPAQTLQPIGLFDNLSDSPVNSGEWSRSEVTLTVNSDAATISVGVLSTGAATVWVRDISLLTTESVHGPLTSEEPVNLKFQAGIQGWRVLEPYRAAGIGKGCHFGGSCAELESHGTMLQTFSALHYRGKVVRLRASLRLQHAGKDDAARLFLRPGRAGESRDGSNLDEHLEYREVRARDWTGVEIVRKIDDDVEEITIGVMLRGKGRVAVDEVSFSVIEDALRPTVITKVRPGFADAPSGSLAAVAVLPASPEMSIKLPETDWPQLPRPSVEEQQAVVNKASVRALAYIHDLPNFLCNLLIDRSENRLESGWRARDVLALQLGFADGKERYRLTTVNGRATSANYRSVGGAISEGDFGGVLAQIFWPHTAKFTWDHWTMMRGRVAHVFRYEVPQKGSTYELQFGGQKGRPVSTLSAHHGYVFIENQTNFVLRLEQIADPPAGFPLRSASTAIDYEWSEVAGQTYLLPLREEITMASATLRSLNVVHFRDYRKFGAESQITFDQPEQSGVMK